MAGEASAFVRSRTLVYGSGAVLLQASPRYLRSAIGNLQRMNRTSFALALLAAGLVSAALLATDPLSRSLLGNSLRLAFGTTAIALPLGTLVAILLARTDVAGRRLLAVMLGVLLILPLLTQLAGWDALIGKLGWLSLKTGSVAEPWLVGMRGAIFVHAMSALPWAALIVAVGLLQADPQLEEVALLDVSPLTVLLRVSLVRAWPFLLGAGVWTVISTTTEMTVTNIYLINTYTEQIYNSFALNTDPLAVGWRLWPGLLLLGVLAAATILVLRQLADAWTSLLHRPAIVFRLGAWRTFLTALLWAFVLLLLALPIASLIVKAGFVTSRTADGQLVSGWSLLRTSEVLSDAPLRFRYEFFWSVVSALAAATLATLAAVMLVWYALRGGWRVIPLALSLTAGLAIPGPLVAVAIIWLLNREGVPGFTWLYDRTIVGPALAQGVRALPIAVLIVWPALASVPRRTLEAAELDGLGRWGQLRWIALPQRSAAMVAAWLLSAAVAFGDLSHSLLVIPPGMDTIQRRLFGLVHAGVDEQVAAVSLLMVAGYAGAAALGWRLIARYLPAGAGQDGVY